MVPSLTQDQINSILRALILSMMPAGVTVTIAQQNLVPEPIGPNFVLVTELSRRRLGTTVTDWDMSVSSNPTVLSYIEAVEIREQLDFYGIGASDNAQVFATLFRSEYATNYMGSTGLMPDFCTDAIQAPFISGESQFQDRWILNATFDANITVVATQDFADTVTIGIIEVDTKYPPS